MFFKNVLYDVYIFFIFYILYAMCFYIIMFILSLFLAFEYYRWTAAGRSLAAGVGRGGWEVVQGLETIISEYSALNMWEVSSQQPTDADKRCNRRLLRHTTAARHTRTAIPDYI